MKAFTLFALLSPILVGCVTTPETGTRAFIITTEQEEMILGDTAYREVLSKSRVSTNHHWQTILQRVGRRIAQAANHPHYEWEFNLIESPQKNAFCLPGGKVAVLSGMMPVSQNEAGLATVVGHEVAHATARHGGQRMTTAFGAQLGISALNKLMGGEETSRDRQLLFAALGAGAFVGLILPFSRANEIEADEIGLIYMARAGYDPREAPRFWKRFAAMGAVEPPAFLSTHPSSESRQRTLESQVSRVTSLFEHSPKLGLGETL